MKRLSRYLLVFFFIMAGLNHFANPDFYTGLIPPYLPYPEWVNGLSGGLEILFALFVLFPSTRKYAICGILLLLVAFIPSHIYFLQIGSCVPQGLCIPEWASWLRLLVGQPLLIWWAWTVGRSSGMSISGRDHPKK